MENKKLFIVGYYDTRIFEGEYFYGKTNFNKNIEVYSLSEVLKLPLIENVEEWVKDTYDKEFESLPYNDKVSMVMEYTDGDELGLAVYFFTEEEALQYKQDIIKEVEEAERDSIYIGKKQDEYGYFREVYRYKGECE